MPLLVIWSRIWREPGVAVAETSPSETRFPQHRADEREVRVRGVDRGSDADLRQLCARHLLDGDDISRAGGLRDQRDEHGEIDLLLLVEVAGRAAGQLDEVLGPPLLLEPRARLLVRREDGARGAELRDHVRDRPALGVGECRHPWAVELEDAATAAAHTPAP